MDWVLQTQDQYILITQNLFPLIYKVRGLKAVLQASLYENSAGMKGTEQFEWIPPTKGPIPERPSIPLVWLLKYYFYHLIYQSVSQKTQW